MRHNRAVNHLGRQSGHRKAMLANMASSLILKKRITTTVAKAKALKPYLEPLVTKSKDDSTHNRRVVFSYLKDKEAVSELFRTIAPKIADRPGGYLRILHRLAAGDNLRDAAQEQFDGNGFGEDADRPGGYLRILHLGFRKGDAADMALVEFVDFNEAALASGEKKEAKKTTRRSRSKKAEAPAAEAPAAEAPAEEKAE